MNWGRMTDQMRVAMGYDDMGNAPHLVSAHDEKLLCDVSRASGDAVCSHCHVLFRLHPVVQGALWATRTCKDGLVKL
jgi:uncharacterized Zn-finger protein